MLKQLRSQKVMKRVLQITLILVIPSFIFYYGWSSSKQSAVEKERYFARIKAGSLKRWHNISQQDLQDSQSRLTQQFARFAGLLGIPQRVFFNSRIQEAIPPLAKITEAVDHYLLLSRGKRIGIYTSRDEIIGQFKARWPQNTAEYVRQYMKLRDIYSEEQLIAMEQQESMASKTKYVLYADAHASLFELWQQFLITDEKIQIDYVKIPLAEFEDKVEIADESLNAYYEEHKEDYRVPDQYVFKYIDMTLADMDTTFTITQDEIAAYYEDNKENFKESRKVKARRILVRVPREISPEQEMMLQNKTDSIYKRIQAGESFANLADQYSDEYAFDGITTPVKNGGLIQDLITPASARQFGQAFVDKTLALQNVGDVTEPFRTQRGFEIARAEEIVPEYYKPFGEVASSIEELLYNTRNKELIGQKASAYSLELYKYTSIEALASVLNQTTEKTSAIEKGDYNIQGIGYLGQYRSAFDEMVNSKEIQIFPLVDKILFMQLQEVISTHIPAREEVKERVTNEYRYSQAKKIARETAESLKEKTREKDSFTSAVQEMGYTAQTTDYFTRDQLPPDLGRILNFQRFTLETQVGDIVISESVAMGEDIDSYIVWFLKDKQAPSLEAFKEALPSLERELIQLKRETLVNEYLADARTKVKLDINPRFIGKAE